MFLVVRPGGLLATSTALVTRDALVTRLLATQAKLPPPDLDFRPAAPAEAAAPPKSKDAAWTDPVTSFMNFTRFN